MNRLMPWAWLWLPLAFFVTAVGWGMASPVGSAPDDDYHLASIWCAPGERDATCVDPGVQPPALLVPAGVAQAAHCYAFQADKTADCAQDVLVSDGLVGTSHLDQVEGLYPGAFYDAMGVLVGPDIERSVLVMRIVNAALAALVLAALLRLLPRGLGSAAVLAIVVTFIPLGLSLVASTNPSTWAIVGVGGYWAFLLGFLTRRRATDRRGLLIGMAAAITALMAVGAREDSAIYVALASAVVVVFAGMRTVRAHAWRITLPVLLSAAGIVTYALRAEPLTGAAGDGAPGTAEAGGGLLLTNLAYFPTLLQGAIGGWNLSWNDVLMPPLVPVIGVLALGALAYRGLSEMWPRKAWAAAVALGSLVGVPIAFLQVQQLGVGELVQPRYILPLLTVLVGVLAMGPRLGRALPMQSGPRWVLTIGLAMSAIIGFWAFSHRFASGSRVGLFDPDGAVAWTGPVGPVPLALVVAVSTSVLVWGAFALVAHSAARTGARAGVH